MQQQDYYTYQCRECGRDIADQEGYLLISITDAYRVKDEQRQWHAEHHPAGEEFRGVSLGEIMELPEEARWVPLHGKCDPHRDIVEYTLGIEDARTPRQLLTWTLHLMDKDWFQYTNWKEFVHETMRADEGPTAQPGVAS